MGNFYHMICQIGTTFYQDNCHWVFIRMKLERKSPNKFCVDFIDILVSCPRLLLMSTKKVKSYIRNCYSEAATGSVIWEKVFLEITQNSQESTFIKKETLTPPSGDCFWLFWILFCTPRHLGFSLVSRV